MRVHELALQRWLNRVFLLKEGFPVPVVFSPPMDAFSHFTELWRMPKDQNPFGYLLDLKDDNGKPLYMPFPAPPLYPIISVKRRGWSYRPEQSFAYRYWRRLSLPTISSDVELNDLATTAQAKMPAAWSFKFQIDHYAMQPMTQALFIEALLRRGFPDAATVPQCWIEAVYPGYFGKKLIRMTLDGDIQDITTNQPEDGKHVEYRTSFNVTVEGYSVPSTVVSAPVLWKIVFANSTLSPEQLESVFTWSDVVPAKQIAQITGTYQYVKVSVPGLKANGSVNVWQNQSTGGTTDFSVFLSDGFFSVSVPSYPETSPGDGLVFNFGWDVEQLSSPLHSTPTRFGVALIRGQNHSVGVSLPGLTQSGSVTVKQNLSNGGYTEFSTVLSNNLLTITTLSQPEQVDGDGLIFSFSWYVERLT